jgi:serine/threonine-protein kinase
MIKGIRTSDLAIGVLVIGLFAGACAADLALFEDLDQAFQNGVFQLAPSNPGPQHLRLHRPEYARIIEAAALALWGLLSLWVFSRFPEAVKLWWLSGSLGVLLLLNGMAVYLLRLSIRGGIIFVALISLYLVLLVRRAFALEKTTQASTLALKALGQNLQKEGFLDFAQEAFAACPREEAARDLLYQLSLEYEQKGMTTRALGLYENLRRQGRYRDLDERMARLQRQEPAKRENDTAPERTGTGLLSDSFLQARRTVGRYRILEQIGKGTMGLVYKALDPTINRLVAIKVIRFSDEFDEEAIQEIKMRFLREAEIAGKLSHPSIVTVHDMGEDQDLTYMAMEYVEGKDLSHYCNKDNPLPVPRILDIVASVAEALEHAHRANVIHRDIKPANIMLLEPGGIKVMDFGIAKAISSSKTKTGVILGTPNYMSPEQIMGHKIDARTDIFSLGVLLFHLLTGDLPFHGKNLSNLLFQITQAKHRPVRSYNLKIPKACEQIISKALSKDPKARFQSAGEMARYLRILLGKIEEIGQKTRAGSPQRS